MEISKKDKIIIISLIIFFIIGVIIGAIEFGVV